MLEVQDLLNNFHHIKTEKFQDFSQRVITGSAERYISQNLTIKKLLQSFESHIKSNFSIWLHDIFNNSSLFS